MTMRSPKYVEAVDWIAMNDSPGDDDSLENLSGLVSVVLVADLFGVDTKTVAGDILARRGKRPGRAIVARQWVAYERRTAKVQ